MPIRIFFLGVALTCTSLALWMIRKQVLVVFPLGSNPKSDQFVTIAGWLDLLWLPIAIVSVIYLFKKRHTFMVAAPSASPPIPQNPLTHGALTALISGVILATFTITMSYHYRWQDFLYMSGLGAIYISAITIYLSIVFFAYARLPRHFPSWALTAFSFASLLVPTWIWLHLSMSVPAGEFGLSSVIPLVAIVMTILFFSLTSLSSPERKSYLSNPLGTYWFWKSLALIGFVRLSGKALRTMERDILFDILQNLYFGITPLLITLVVLSFSGALIRSLGKLSWFKVLLISPLLGLFAYVGINYDQAWTYRVEHNKPFASHVSKVSRKVIAALGFSDERPVATKINWMRNLVKSLPETQMPQGVYPSLDNPAIPHPHIFIFVADAVTEQRMGVYGYERNNTPYLSAIKKDSVRFTNFHANSSATYRGVLSMFSGHFAYRIGRTEHDNSLCEILEERNYMTYIANAVAPLVKANDGCARAKTLSPDGIQSQDFQAIELDLKNNPDRPIFHYAHVRGGHNPWTLPQEERIFGDNRLDIYDALIYQSDQQFKNFVDWIERMGIKENSLIIFTSDHGIGLGYHMDMSSYSHLYTHNTRIPFIVQTPGKFGGDVEDYLSQIDITPTLADMIGVNPNEPMMGRSFADLLKETRTPKSNCVFGSAEYRHSYAITCSDGTKLIWNVDENTLEYFASNDPMELDNQIDAISENDFKLIAKRFAPYLALMQRRPH